MTEHLFSCTGNGAVPCHWCMGAGDYEQPLDDVAEETVPCRECGGRGFFPCPACAESMGGDGT